jgi:hypothetical protein
LSGAKATPPHKKAFESGRRLIPPREYYLTLSSHNQ